MGKEANCPNTFPASWAEEQLEKPSFAITLSGPGKEYVLDYENTSVICFTKDPEIDYIRINVHDGVLRIFGQEELRNRLIIYGAKSVERENPTKRECALFLEWQTLGSE